MNNMDVIEEGNGIAICATIIRPLALGRARSGHHLFQVPNCYNALLFTAIGLGMYC
jgi:hypothetical protein